MAERLEQALEYPLYSWAVLAAEVRREWSRKLGRVRRELPVKQGAEELQEVRDGGIYP